MSTQRSRGDCTYCGREMTRGGLSNHLRTCSTRQEVITAANAGGAGKDQPLYHLLVQDAYSGDFWLHLEMNGASNLSVLDNYLRAIWLECCGHLSAFTIGPRRYTQLFDDGMSWGDERSMQVQVQKLFKTDMRIEYEYDFGSTTELVIRVMDERVGKPTTRHPIVLMARNKWEPLPCIECGQPAAYICLQCWEEREDERGELCEEHATDHPHDDYGEPMGLFNSPRTGVCGYDGPAEPPY